MDFICGHSDVQKDKLEQLMMAKDMMAKDLGTILVGSQAVEIGLINRVGGLKDAICQLKSMIAQ